MGNFLKELIQMDKTILGLICGSFAIAGILIADSHAERLIVCSMLVFALWCLLS